jgi:hypothetical protein
LVALAAACASSAARSLGSGPTAPSRSPTATSTPSASPNATNSPARLFSFQVWMTQGGPLFETKRTEPFDVAVGKLALTALLKGPTPAEAALDVRSAIPQGTTLTITSLAAGTATVGASPPLPLRTAKAQVVFTLTQYANIQKVRFAGDPATYTRRNLEWALPAITVESPSIGQQVSSPIRVSGTANVFEGTVNVRVLDANQHKLAETFTTATCGSGCRGDYSASLRYHVDHQQTGYVSVFDYSAQDGSMENTVTIPVILSASNDPPSSPAIVVNSPKSGSEVSSPVTVSGTADVFEAQLRIRILDESGHVLADVPVHASCGTGCRGTFSAKISFHVSHRQHGEIWAFDYSPRDGSMIDLVKVRVILLP